VTEAAWGRCVQGQGPGWIAFDAIALLARPQGVQRNLLRRAIKLLRPGLRDDGFETVERGLDFIQQSTRTGQTDFIAGLRMRREGDCIWLAGWEVQLPDEAGPGPGWPQVQVLECQPLTVPGQISLNGGWRLLAGSPTPTGIDRFSAFENTPYQAWLDWDSLSPGGLCVRGRRPGDRLRPLGLEGHSLKLSDFFINSRLPARARARWPLVLSGSEIAWVPGLRPAHPFRVTASTRQLIHLTLDNEPFSQDNLPDQAE
jgi:tRNA(Ile)-lysidine synthase